MRQVIRAVRLVHQPTVARISRRRRERRLRKQHRRQHRRSSPSSTRPHNQRYTSRYKTSISLAHYPSLELSGATRFYRLQLELNSASLGRKDISHQRLPLDGLIGFTKWIYLGTFISLSLWRVRRWARGKKRLTRCCILKNFFFLHPASLFLFRNEWQFDMKGQRRKMFVIFRYIYMYFPLSFSCAVSLFFKCHPIG